MPEAYLFDIGNVIIAFDFRKAADRIAPQCLVTPEEALRVVTGLSPELERGVLTEDEFVSECVTAIGFDGPKEQFREAVADIFELNEPMVGFIEHLKSKGVPLFLLSNTNGIHVPFFEAKYPVFGHFDDRVYSHQVKAMKPEPEIYQITISQLGIDPTKTIYIDDSGPNCDAGRQAGFLSIRYDLDDHSGFMDRIAQMAPDHSI